MINELPQNYLTDHILPFLIESDKPAEVIPVLRKIMDKIKTKDAHKCGLLALKLAKQYLESKTELTKVAPNRELIDVLIQGLQTPLVEVGIGIDSLKDLDRLIQLSDSLKPPVTVPFRYICPRPFHQASILERALRENLDNLFNAFFEGMPIDAATTYELLRVAVGNNDIARTKRFFLKNN